MFNHRKRQTSSIVRYLGGFIDTLSREERFLKGCPSGGMIVKVKVSGLRSVLHVSRDV